MFNGLKRKEELPPAVATKNPGDFDLGSLESRVAARALAQRQKDQGIRIAVYTIGTNRPTDEPKPKHRFQNGLMEMYYQDDDDYHDR